MGTPNPLEAVRPDDCGESDFKTCTSFAPVATQEECNGLCSDCLLGDCSLYVWFDRGANINPRYCIYILSLCSPIWDGFLCECIGTYVFDHCSDVEEGNPVI